MFTKPKVAFRPLSKLEGSHGGYVSNCKKKKRQMHKIGCMSPKPVPDPVVSADSPGTLATSETGLDPDWGYNVLKCVFLLQSFNVHDSLARSIVADENRLKTVTTSQSIMGRVTKTALVNEASGGL